MVDLLVGLLVLLRLQIERATTRKGAELERSPKTQNSGSQKILWIKTDAKLEKRGAGRWSKSRAVQAVRQHTRTHTSHLVKDEQLAEMHTHTPAIQPREANAEHHCCSRPANTKQWSSKWRNTAEQASKTTISAHRLGKN